MESTFKKLENAVWKVSEGAFKAVTAAVIAVAAAVIATVALDQAGFFDEARQIAGEDAMRAIEGTDDIPINN